jgi:FMN-dependent NADH-azoreductase
MKLLRIDSSARGTSVTRKLTAAFTDAWKTQHQGGSVIERDTCSSSLPAITDEWSATYSDPATLTVAQREYLSVSDSLIAELSAADTIIIGAPMYNLTVSAPLKAWIDQVVRVGKTFAYGPTGPKGLLDGKKTVVVTARGGSYTLDFAAPNFDLEEAYLRRILGFIGLTDVSFIHADYQMGSEKGDASLASAIGLVEMAAAEPHAAATA